MAILFEQDTRLQIIDEYGTYAMALKSIEDWLILHGIDDAEVYSINGLEEDLSFIDAVVVEGDRCFLLSGQVSDDHDSLDIIQGYMTDTGDDVFIFDSDLTLEQCTEHNAIDVNVIRERQSMHTDLAHHHGYLTEKKFCSFCQNNDRIFPVIGTGCYFSLEMGNILSVFTDKHAALVDIRYCPVCGRPLKRDLSDERAGHFNENSKISRNLRSDELKL